MNKTEKVVADIAENFRKPLIEQFIANVKKVVESFKNEEDGFYYAAYPSSSLSRNAYRQEMYKYHMLCKYCDRVERDIFAKRSEPYKFTIKEDFEEEVLKDAIKDTDYAIEKFKYKTNGKLNSICENKGIDYEVKAHGNINSNTMFFKFTDGSQFLVINQIVGVFCMSKVPHYRFPTTFHNVIFADGTKMKQPSEAKMKKEF